MSHLLDELAYYVNPNKPLFLEAVIVTALCPLIWNSMARLFRYYTHTIAPSTSTTIRYGLCYLMTAWIFCFSSFRDLLFHNAISAQQAHPVLHSVSYITHPLAVVLVVVGQVFVLSSFYQLGITGTFLGDYVGILMDAPVTAFPFSVLENPMYVGATLCFVGSSLWYDSAAGLVLTSWIWVTYAIALQFEGPYTAMIYAQRDQQRKRGNKKKN